MTIRESRPTTGVARLVAFTDGVVAIAITLIVLPLVDAARDGISGTEFVQKNYLGLIAAAVSFRVIAGFWKDHHRLYDHVTASTRSLVNLNLIWLAAIVFLPLPTVLIVASPGRDPVAAALYILTLLVASVSVRLQETLLVRAGLFEAGAQPSRRTLRADWVLPVIELVALIVTLLIPATGLYPLFLLVLAWPINLLLRRGSRERRML